MWHFKCTVQRRTQSACNTKFVQLNKHGVRDLNEMIPIPEPQVATSHLWVAQRILDFQVFPISMAEILSIEITCADCAVCIGLNKLSEMSASVHLRNAAVAHYAWQVVYEFGLARSETSDTKLPFTLQAPRVWKFSASSLAEADESSRPFGRDR